MKLFLRFIFCCFFVQINGQSDDADLQKRIDFYKTKIEQSDGNNKMQWIDSLVRAVWERPELKYDSISKVSINFAFELDSLAKASRVLSDLMYYHNNIANQPQNTIELYDLYYEKFENLNDDFALGSLNLYVGDAYTRSNDYEQGILYYKKAISYGKKSPQKKLEGLATLYLGYSQSSRGEFSKASENYRNATELFVTLKDTLNLINVKNALAILYSKNDFFEEAKTERFEAIEMAKKINYGSSLVSMYYNTAMDFKKTGDFERQISYLKASKKVNDSYEYGTYIKKILLAELSKAYANTDSLILAKSNFKELEVVLQNEYEDTYENDRYYLDAKKTLSFAQGNYEDALKYGQRYVDIQRKRKMYEELMRGEKFLSDVYASIGIVDKQNQHLVTYHKIKDSIASVKKIKSLTYYQTLYETEKRDRKIESQGNNIALLDARNSAKNQWIIFGSLGLLLSFFLFTLTRSRRNTERERKQQEKFSQDLMESQEKERTRIAKELHDSVGQKLTLIKRQLQNGDQPALTKLSNDALEEVRSISRGLYPALLKELGLTLSIVHLINEYDEQTELFFTTDIDTIDNYFTDAAGLNFYRLIQECLTNIVKHAKAKAVTVSIKVKEQSIITLIADNGKGFNLENGKKQNTLGLKTIFERIKILEGQLSIDSQLHTGTNFILTIPIKYES